MQSGYGEMQQFMVDNCPPSLFSSIQASQSNTNSNATQNPSQEIHKFHPLSHPPTHFAHFGHPIPITQQFFHQQQTHHQFQLFHLQQQQQQQQQQQHHHHQQMGLDHESEPDNPNSPAGPASFLAAMNFKLGVNESSGGSRDDDGILQGADDGGSHDDTRLHHHHHNHHSWHRDADSGQATNNIKQPFWRPLDIDYINPNNKRPSKDKQQVDISSNVKHFKKSTNEVLDQDGNYKLFSELEAIYKPGGTPNISNGGGGADGGVINCNHQTGSGSALTGDEHPLLPLSAPEPTMEQHDTISDTSNNDEVLPTPPPAAENKVQKGSSSSAGRRTRMKRRQQKELASIASFFESLVKQLMDHQENLHCKFLQVMERKDQERTNREETWRKQETARANKEAAARAQERALAASRESAIISFLEKITGESLSLPTKIQIPNQNIEESNNVISHDQQIVELEQNSSGIQLSSSRWPKTEVQALIRVRSGFENRFQEPGLKGPLWEEVSLAMGALGYQRSSKRCKEKWENINKYFRKAKDSGKKRPQHSKTCPYFQQLDQLYLNSKSNNANVNGERKDNSELLDAIIVSNDGGLRRNVEYNGNDNELANNDEEEEDDEEGDGEEGQGESQAQAQAQNLQILSNPLHGNAAHV